MTFSVGTDDDSAYEFQWYFNGVDYSGGTGPSLTLTGVQFANDGVVADLR